MGSMQAWNAFGRFLLATDRIDQGNTDGTGTPSLAAWESFKSLWAAAAGCNSSDSETDGWHPVHPSKPPGQSQQVAILRIPKLTDGALSAPQNCLGAAAAGCNSSDSETDGWHPVHPSRPSGQPQQVAILGIPKLTDGALSAPQNCLGSRGRLQF